MFEEVVEHGQLPNQELQRDNWRLPPEILDNDINYDEEAFQHAVILDKEGSTSNPSDDKSEYIISGESDGNVDNDNNDAVSNDQEAAPV